MVVRAVGVAVAYVLAGLAALALSGGAATLLWPPAGIALAGLLLFGVRVWPAVWVASTAVNLAHGQALWAAAIVGAGSTASPVVATVLLERLGSFRVSMDRVRDIVLFAVVAVALTPGIAAAVGATVVILSGTFAVDSWAATLVTWWAGDSASVLILTPATLALFAGVFRDEFSAVALLEAAGLAAVTLLVSALVFGERVPDPAVLVSLLAPFFFLLVGAFRFGLLGVSLVVVAVSFVAVWSTSNGHGPFAGGVTGLNATLHSYVTSLGAAGLLMWALVAEHRRALERFQAVFDGSSDGILILSHGRVVHCNAAALRMFGTTSRERLVGRRFDELAPARQPDGTPSSEASAGWLERSEGGRTPRFAWQHQRLDGTTFMSDVALSPVLIDGRRAHVCILRDVTDRLEHEQQLEEAKAHALRASEAKSEFLANMSHELRTPMNAILGFAQLMARDAVLAAEHRRGVEMILSSGGQLMELLDEVLDLARLESGRVSLSTSEFDLPRLLDDVEVMHMLAAERKGLMLVFEPDPSLPTFVRMDRRKLRQILVNLIDNAVKFTESGGITVRATLGSGSIEGWPRLLIEVADTGRGMSEELQARVFEPFEQGEGMVGQNFGTGLGLPLSLGYARMMGGDLTVTSKAGEGARFRLELPVQRVERDGAPHESDDVIAEIAPPDPRARTLDVDLAGLDTETKTRMRDAALSADYDRLIAILDEIGDEPMTAPIREMAIAFDYDGLAALLCSGPDEP